MPRVSVICTSYNAGAYLEQAFRSVAGQTYKDWELVVEDDDSSCETTLATLRTWRYRSQVRIAKWVTHDRSTAVRYARLINWGVRHHSSGEYITFLCGDDYYLPDRLERMVARLDEGHDIVYGSQRLIDEADRVIGVRRTQGTLVDAYCRVDLNSVMLRRSAFEEVRGFDDTPPTAEMWRRADGIFWRKLTTAGYVFVPVLGMATDVKRYKDDSVDARVIRGQTPW